MKLTIVFEFISIKPFLEVFFFYFTISQKNTFSDSINIVNLHYVENHSNLYQFFLKRNMVIV